MTKKDMIKTVGGIIVSVGVGAILENAIKATTPRSTGMFKNICIGVGGIVITGMVTKKAIEYVEGYFEDGIKQFKSMIKEEEI